MRDPNRIYPILNKLSELWGLYPDLRFYQLVELIGLAKDNFNTEDDVTLKRIQELIDLYHGPYTIEENFFESIEGDDFE